jgi:hypothetical protein
MGNAGPLVRHGSGNICAFPGCTERLVDPESLVDEAVTRPPLRSTSFTTGGNAYLYTTGYIPELERYPHGHVPSPLLIADHIGDTAGDQLQREILTLTKMNWNSANMHGLMPITLQFSRLVADVLREIPGDQTPEPIQVLHVSLRIVFGRSDSDATLGG